MIENNHHHPVLIGTNLHFSQISIFRQNREGWGTRETRCAARSAGGASPAPTGGRKKGTQAESLCHSQFRCAQGKRAQPFVRPFLRSFLRPFLRQDKQGRQGEQGEQVGEC